MKNINIGIITLIAVLAVSISVIRNTSQASALSITDFEASSVLDDNCYATLSTASQVKNDVLNLIGQETMMEKWGLVNAIVRVPVYDWDQSPPEPVGGVLGTDSFNVSPAKPAVKPIGYLQYFSAKVTPVPNIQWISDYITKQLPYDVSVLANIGADMLGYEATIGVERPQPNFVANPLIYQRASIIKEDGWPNVLFENSAYEEPEEDATVSEEADNAYEDKLKEDLVEQIKDKYDHPWSGIIREYERDHEDDEGDLNYNEEQEVERLEAERDAKIALAQSDPHRFMAENEGYSITQENNINGGVLSGIKKIFDIVGGTLYTGGVSKDNILEFADKVRNSSNVVTSELVGIAAKTFFDGVQFSVDAENTGDNCHEYLDNESELVPSYAFSVPKIAAELSLFPWTFPGTFITPITVFAGKGVSAAGVTKYGESANDKMMLDCYGRGLQPTIVASNESIGDSDRGHGRFLGLVPYPKLNRWEGWLYLFAVGLDAAIAAGTGGTATNWVKSLPMPDIVYENYYNGVAYLFSVDEPQRSHLPEELQSREIDYTNSKLDSIDAQTLAGGEGHGSSANGKSYYPNLYVKLKKPYKHDPEFDDSLVQKKQDGSYVSVKPKISKDGFKNSPKYNKGGNKNDVPVANLAKARIAEIILEPGQSGSQIRDRDYTGGELGTTDGMNADQLCGFLRSKVGSTDAQCDASSDEFGGSSGINLTSMDGSPYQDNTSSFNLVSGSGIIQRKIPAETKPGTKYCYVVYLQSRDNDFKYAGREYYTSYPNYNANYSATQDKRYLSRAHCVISGYKPSFQVRGGDLISGGVIDTEVNKKEYLADPTMMRTYGSWVEYGAISALSTTNLATGAGYRVGMISGPNTNMPETPVCTATTSSSSSLGGFFSWLIPLWPWLSSGSSTSTSCTSTSTATPTASHVTKKEVGPLMFSNNRNVASSADYGKFGDVNDGFADIATQFIEGADTAEDLTTDNVDVSTLESGVYKLRQNTKIMGSAPIQSSRSIILLAPEGGVVEITGDIKLSDSYPSENEISQVVISPASFEASDDGYKININPNVSRVDAWLINPKGKLNTCYINSSNIDDQTPRGFDWPCYQNTLTINGPVSAKELYLRRSASKDQNDVPNYTPLLQSVAGENFNLRADAYIWASNYVRDFGKKLVTTNILDLPPRL